MLPSTGIFKTIDCPFFDEKADNCNRPYCHFRHAVKEHDETASDDQATATNVEQKPQIQILLPPIVYKPTPKAILDARKSTNVETTTAAPSSASSSEAPKSKRPKHEYVPKSKSSSKQNNLQDTPTYTPSSLIAQLSDDLGDSYVPKTTGLAVVESFKEHIEQKNNDPIQEISDGGQTNGNKSALSESKQGKTGKEDESSPKHRHHKSSRTHSSSSSSKKLSRDRDKHRSSTSSRSDRSSSKEPSAHKASRSISSIKSPSSSSKHTYHSSSHRSSKSSSRTEDKHTSSRSKSKHRDRSKDRESSSKSRHRSSRSKDHHRSDRKCSSSSSKTVSIGQDDDNSASNEVSYDVGNISYDEDDEDDVEAQCRMIFEEYTPDEAAKLKNAASSTSTGNDLEGDPVADKYENSGMKKRVAYENADRVERPTQAKATNHVQNAMQSIFKRQEIVRKQFELKEQKEAENIAKRQKEQAKTIKSTSPGPSPAESKTFSALSSAPKLTPLISPAVGAAMHSRPLNRPIAAVSNLMAIQKAKEKIEELKAAKLRQQNFTVATTVAKGVARVAHVNKAVETTPTRPAPPILEPTATKISHNIRSQYYNIMVKHCLTIYDNCEDAWERAQTEELSVFKKCSTPVIYKQSAALAINKLRKESLDGGNVNTEKNKTVSHDVILAGKYGQQCSWNVNQKLKTDTSGSSNLFDTTTGEKAYEMIAELQLTEEQLRENGYPRAGPKSGMAQIFKPQTGVTHNDHDRYCRRCGKLYTLDHYDEVCVDQCNYHPKRPGFRRGFADNAHLCCQQPAGSAGCMYGNYHVTDYLDYNNLTGFVKTIPCPENYVPRRKDIYALDCEMCYTTIGLELTRVTVVDINKKVVYDALVKPDNRIIDYNTKFSGISEETLRNETRTLRDVQAVLLSMFNSKTVLVGHSLESDLKALKMVHDVVVDTSILFPHRMGPPKKRALKTLCIENLKRIIQEDDAGHNSAEDAEVCIDLIKHYLRNRIN